MSEPKAQVTIVLINGFSQDAADDTGMRRLRDRLRRHAARGPFAATTILLREWEDDVEPLAARIPLNARIIIIGYSYGGGWAAPRLARVLKARGRRVELMILIDPVWRAPLMLLKWLSFTGAVPVTVPGNVRNVVSWRQRSGPLLSPRGSRLKLEDGRATRIVLECDVSLLGVDHTSIQYDADILDAAFHHTIHCIEGVQADETNHMGSARGSASVRRAGGSARSGSAARLSRAGCVDRRRVR